jgi:hypothetical protein
MNRRKLKMNLPGFSAEASLKHATGRYFFPSMAGETDSGVMAAFRRQQTAGGCGACVELKWPNGTGTGACMQDCCDLLGNCKFEPCTCGGGIGGGGSSIFSTRAFNAGSFARF